MGDTPTIFIECKSPEANLPDHDAQLARYFNATPCVKLAVVTNGTRYRFFTDLREPNVMDGEHFFEFDVTSFTERDVEILRPFTKAEFDSAAVQAHAEDLIYIVKVTSLVNDLLRNPSESFVRYLLAELDLVPGRVTARVVERFVPIVKKAIQTTLLDMMTKSLQQEIAPEKSSPPPPPPANEQPPEVAEHAAKRVVTTEEELAIFDIVKRICSESPLKYDIEYKDTVSWFVINVQGKSRGWFIRVCTGGSRKYILTRLPKEQVDPLTPGFEVGPESPWGKSRVFFSEASDFEKLRVLVMTAYEDVARGLEAGTDRAFDSGNGAAPKVES